MREALRAEAYLQYRFKVEETGSQARGGPPQGNFPSIAAIGQEIKNIYDVAATDGTRNAARVASFFVLMGACSSLLIPGGVARLRNWWRKWRVRILKALHQEKAML